MYSTYVLYNGFLGYSSIERYRQCLSGRLLLMMRMTWHFSGRTSFATFVLITPRLEDFARLRDLPGVWGNRRTRSESEYFTGDTSIDIHSPGPTNAKTSL